MRALLLTRRGRVVEDAALLRARNLCLANRPAVRFTALLFFDGLRYIFVHLVCVFIGLRAMPGPHAIFYPLIIIVLIFDIMLI